MFLIPTMFIPLYLTAFKLKYILRPGAREHHRQDTLIWFIRWLDVDKWTNSSSSLFILNIIHCIKIHKNLQVQYDCILTFFLYGSCIYRDIIRGKILPYEKLLWNHFYPKGSKYKDRSDFCLLKFISNGLIQFYQTNTYK